jgi:predicted transcriptional regulator
MRLRNTVTAGIAGVAVAGGAVVAMGAGGAAANAASATVSTSSSTVTMVSSRCYHTHRVTVTTYFYSKTKGWQRYAAPKRTVTDSTTCH